MSPNMRQTGPAVVDIMHIGAMSVQCAFGILSAGIDKAEIEAELRTGPRLPASVLVIDSGH
jgi:hypothetical protein